jgi:glutamate-1-semialdehyde aminotransferase
MNLQKSLNEYQKAQDLIFNGVKRMNMLADIHKYPLYFEKSKGAYTWDVDGNKYIDFISGKGAIILGYSDDGVNQVVKDQIDRSNLMPLNSTAQNSLAELFIQEIPCAERVRFFRTGSCATSALIRLARAYTNKDIILTTGYHGWHDSFMSGRAGVPATISQNIISFNYSLDTLKSLLESNKGQVAAVFITPEPCFFDENFYLACFEVAKENHVLFLLDEVKTGFRVSLHGYQHILEIVPDGACFSKAMSNGYPISAVAGSVELMEAEERTHLSGTFDTEVSCMEAAIQTIKQLRENDVNQIVSKYGRYFANQLSAIFYEYGFPAICKADDSTAFHIIFKSESIAEDFYCGCADRGVLFYCNNNVMMNAAHTIDVIDDAVNVCRDTIKHMTNYQTSQIDSSDILAYLKRSRIQR